jgi:hypothetical protein
MDHTTLRELTAGAALDDLDPAERAELDGHLATCLECQALAGQLDDVLGDLALLAPDLRPPSSLRGQVLTALREPVQVRYERPSMPVALVTRRDRPDRRPLIASLGLAAALAVVAVGLGARTVQLNGDLEAAQAAVVAAESRVAARNAAMAVVADPEHVTAALHAEPIAPGVESVVVFRPGSDEAYLMATDLPPTPAGRVYQLWYADAEGVHPLGTFHHDGTGPFIAPFGVDLTHSVAAMVTLEPEGGAQGTPGPEVIFGEL